MVDSKKINNTNTATTFNPHPKTGRCIHHPTIRLRKKKLFGRGWKIVIGHCPDCCLDEMKRMAVEMRGGSNNGGSDDENRRKKNGIDGFNSIDSVNNKSSSSKKKVKFDKLDNEGREQGGEEENINRCISTESSSTVRTIYPEEHPIHQKRKDKSPKKKHRDKDDRERRRGSSKKSQMNNSDHNDSLYSDLVNEDQLQRNLESHMKKQKQQQQQEGRINDKGEDQGTNDSSSGDVTTGSTAPNSSMDGNSSLLSTSEQQYNNSNNNNNIPSQREHPPPPPPRFNVNHHQNTPPPPPPQKTQQQRKMVLSIKYQHPKTGKRGTYTGEVLNIINSSSSNPQQQLLPDGKGTVYYADGSIEEGTWSNGLLIGDNKDDYPGLHHQQQLGSIEEGSPIVPGSLDKLDRLGGKKKKKSRHHANLPPGSSASAQSYHSHGSHDGSHQNTNIPSGSASVQDYRRSSSGTSFASLQPQVYRRKSSLEDDGGGGTSVSVTSSHSKSSFAEEKGVTSNLDSLDRLGKNKNVPRGASASVQSYNSHGSKGSTNIPMGGSSASVQDYRSSGNMLDYRGGSVSSYHSSSHRAHQQHSQSMNAIGEWYREDGRGSGSGGLDTSGRSKNSTEQEDERSDDDDNYSSSSSSSSSSTSSSNASEYQVEAAKASDQIMNELFGAYTKRKIVGRPKALTSKDYAISPISTKIPTLMQRPKKTSSSSSSSTKTKDNHSMCRNLVKDADSNATRTMRHLSDNLRSEIDRWVAHANKVEYELDQVETLVINQCKHGKKLLTDNFNLLSDKQKLEDKMKKKDEVIKTMKRQLRDATRDAKTAEAKVKRLEQQVTKLQMQLLNGTSQ